MDADLKTLLIGVGAMTQTGIMRRARIQTCRTCHHPILAGLDSERAALEARCDLDRLSTTGEAEALLAGRTTYDLHGHTGDRPVLERRDQWTIRTPADSRLVLASHTCHQPIPAAWTTPMPPARPQPTQRELF
jgi:hypothetical protein